MIPSRTIDAESWPSVRASCGACTAQYRTHSVRGFAHPCTPRPLFFPLPIPSRDVALVWATAGGNCGESPHDPGYEGVESLGC
jgi:hypothetical protein